MNEQPAPIRAIEAAWKDMVAVLFSPFDYVKWLLLGVPLFLINCGGGGGGNYNFNYNMGGGPGGGPGQSPFTEVVQWVDQNLALLAIIIALVLLFFVLVTVLAAFLQSRGIFMLINMLSSGVFNLGTAWNNSSRLANSFFFYLLVVSAIWMVLPMLYILIILGWPFLRGVLMGEYGWAELIRAFTILGIYFVLVGIPLMILNIIVRNFAVPVMAATGQKVIPATLEAFRLVFSQIGSSLLYLLLVFVMSIASFAILALAGCLLVCLIIGCIPFVGQYAVAVLTAPVGIFMWAYSLRFVEQFGERYKVLPDTLGIPPVPPLPTFEGQVPHPSGYGSPSGGGSGSWPPAPMPPSHPPQAPPPPPSGPPPLPPSESPRE